MFSIGETVSFREGKRERTGQVVSRYTGWPGEWLVVQAGEGERNRFHVPTELAKAVNPNGR